MKKILAFLLATVLFATCAFMAVSAAPSPEAQGVISSSSAEDKDGNEVSVTIEKIDGKVTKTFEKGLSNLKKEIKDNNVKVVAQYEIKTPKKVKYPLSISLNVLGVSGSSKLFVLVEDKNGNVETIEVKAEEGKIDFTLEKAIKNFAIVADKETVEEIEKENDVLAPQTGDFSLALVFAMFVSILTAVFAFKKVNA